MIYNERNTRKERILQAAESMMNAARTAPKGRGNDAMEIITITEQEILHLADMMDKIGEEKNESFFHRDADNIRQAGAVVLIGSKNQPLGLHCSLCGFKTCEQKPTSIPCVFNSVDVGIAIGSACAMAQRLCIDTRVMFSAGKAAEFLNFLPECPTIFAIPLSISSKNPFFDRKPL
ncbi:MAG: DUF2148 domain-containing protein [Bacteroidales bacterium]|nr:DUF2148 domain-containing protein [Bacteroidales bacterium]